LSHFKLDPVVKIDATFQRRLDELDVKAEMNLEDEADGEELRRPTEPLSAELEKKVIEAFQVFYYYKDVFTHKDINTYINGVL